VEESGNRVKDKKIPGSLPRPGNLAKNVVGNFFIQREREIMEVTDNCFLADKKTELRNLAIKNFL